METNVTAHQSPSAAVLSGEELSKLLQRSIEQRRIPVLTIITSHRQDLFIGRLQYRAATACRLILEAPAFAQSTGRDGQLGAAAPLHDLRSWQLIQPVTCIVKSRNPSGGIDSISLVPSRSTGEYYTISVTSATLRIGKQFALSEAERELLRSINNPEQLPVGAHTGRCGICASTDLWRDEASWGCHCCNEMWPNY